ncbi:hypothetical protein Fmac_023117 [Flemingia macrophylla]|uniref:Uncharacterized protein n=1 Tax=Flemingia macrophylla TaxID=520843 RepID=A0ABD1LKK8_9FABA
MVVNKHNLRWEVMMWTKVRGGYSSGGRRSYGIGDRIGQDDSFKCGHPRH